MNDIRLTWYQGPILPNPDEPLHPCPGCQRLIPTRWTVCICGYRLLTHSDCAEIIRRHCEGPPSVPDLRDCDGTERGLLEFLQEIKQ